MKVETGYHHFGLLTLHVLIYNSVWALIIVGSAFMVELNGVLELNKCKMLKINSKPVNEHVR